MGNLFAELKRRHIYRVAAAYAVVGWVLIQLVNNVAPLLHLPDWAGTLFLVALLAGFPVALLFAWIHQLVPVDGAALRPTTGKLDWALIGALVVLIALATYQQLAPSPGTTTARQPSGVEAARAEPAPAGISVAVLPFTNLSSDKEQEFFSDGMTEEITAALTQVPGLRVLGRTSAFQFKGQNQDLRTIGHALGATHLIEGSVRKAGNRVRITAQLVRTDDDLHIWAQNYDRELTDIFATQEDIAQAIAAALRVPLGLRQGDTLVRNRTNDLESYDQYLRALALVRAHAITDAIKLLEPIVARDPSFAPAWALLARAYQLVPDVDLALRSGSLEEARRVVQSSLDKAEKAAREAIRLDTANAVGYSVLASIQGLRGKWVAAENFYKQALALDPNEPDVLSFYSLMLSAVGNLKEALSINQKLRTLEHFIPGADLLTADFMQITGQSQASIPILEAIPIDASLGYVRNSLLARAYAADGRYAQAADTLLLATAEAPVSRRSVEDAARLLRSAPTKVAPEALPELRGGLNFVYAYVGAPDRVLEPFERSVELQYEAGFRDLWFPHYAPARKTERFKALMRNAGVVDYWRARGWPDLCHPTTAGDFVCD